MWFWKEQMHYTSQNRICNPIETHKSKLFSLSHTRRNKHHQLRKFFDLLDRTPCKMYHISYLSLSFVNQKGSVPLRFLRKEGFWSDRPQQMLFWRIFFKSHQFTVEFYQTSANDEPLKFPHYLIYSPCLVWRHITRAYGQQKRDAIFANLATRLECFFDWSIVLSRQWK